MILEGIVTTVSADDQVNIAPMGPQVASTMDRFVLRPFQTAQTYRNLRSVPEGVFHITDDVLLLARTAIGQIGPAPALIPATKVRGMVLEDCCRFFEFQVIALDDRTERTRIEVATIHSGRRRDFFGFNRAKHAVIEAAILATRIHLLPFEAIAADYTKLALIVDKTGGEQEHQAFSLLRAHVQRVTQSKMAQTKSSPLN
jgi:hypothetical protein